MLDSLLLLSGNDIPFNEAGIAIHPPRIGEIALIGEERFFMGCELLTFSKNILDDKDKTRLESLSNFEILMSIVNDTSKELSLNRASFLMVLTLLFPKHQISFTNDDIELAIVDKNGFLGERCYITKNNFEKLKEIINQMFCMEKSEVSGEQYAPSGALSEKIAKKLKERKKKLAKQKTDEPISIFSRYVSILAVGESKDINDLMNYTVYQLFDEYERFEKKQAHDFYVQAKLAGAKELKEVDNWMIDIHSKSNKK